MLLLLLLLPLLLLNLTKAGGRLDEKAEEKKGWGGATAVTRMSNRGYKG